MGHLSGFDERQHGERSCVLSTLPSFGDGRLNMVLPDPTILDGFLASERSDPSVTILILQFGDNVDTTDGSK